MSKETPDRTEISWLAGEPPKLAQKRVEEKAHVNVQEIKGSCLVQPLPLSLQPVQTAPSGKLVIN